MNRWVAIFAAALIGACVGALAVVAASVLLFAVALSGFVPVEGGSLLLYALALAVFGAAFTFSFREMLEKFTR